MAQSLSCLWILELQGLKSISVHSQQDQEAKLPPSLCHPQLGLIAVLSLTL